MSGSASSTTDARRALETAFLAGVAAVDPTKLVKAHIRKGLLDDWFEDRDKPRPLWVLALGKAAPRMVWGLVEANVPFSGIGVATKGIARPQLERFQWHVGDHPMPGPASFAAGAAVQDWVASLPADARILVLVSGGASACIEAGDPETILADWEASAGLDVTKANEQRGKHSPLKHGRLGNAILVRTRHARAWVLSDVPPGRAEVVASGPVAAPGIEHRVLADGKTAADAAGAALASEGYTPYAFPRRIEGDAATEVRAFCETLASLPPKSALVAFGEPTVQVVGSAPGGRSQHAALAAAAHLGPGSMFLAAGTDGVDGSTRAAGAWTTAGSWSPKAEAALRAYDAHAFLTAQGQTLRTGPTGTNVADLWLGLVPEA